MFAILLLFCRGVSGRYWWEGALEAVITGTRAPQAAWQSGRWISQRDLWSHDDLETMDIDTKVASKILIF